MKDELQDIPDRSGLWWKKGDPIPYWVDATTMRRCDQFHRTFSLSCCPRGEWAKGKSPFDRPESR